MVCQSESASTVPPYIAAQKALSTARSGASNTKLVLKISMGDIQPPATDSSRGVRSGTQQRHRLPKEPVALMELFSGC